MMHEEPEVEQSQAKRPALSLAYDGADPSHLEIVLPLLAELNMRGTFFVPSVELLKDPRRWVSAHHQGHEFGSHSLDGFTDERGNLPNWTLDMVEEDLRMSRKLLTELFSSQTDFAFAYPGDQQGCVTAPYNPQPTSYEPVVEKLFRVARTIVEGTNSYESLQTHKLKSIDTFGMVYDDLVEFAEGLKRKPAWAILVFRSVGTGQMGIDARDHARFVRWLAEQSDFDVPTVYQNATRLATSAFLP